MADLVMTPYFQIPFKITRGRIGVVEQDTDDEVVQTATTVLRYERGQRIALPEYGISDQALRMGGADTREIEQAVAAWEPRLDSVGISKKDFYDIAEEVVTVQMNPAEV